MSNTRVVNGPGFKVCYEDEPSYLRAYVFDGTDSVEVSIAMWRMLAAEGAAVGATRMLILEDLVSTVELQDLATVIDAIRTHRSVYLMAVGGSAYLVSKAIKSARVVGFADLGMEAIYEFEVKDMPVTVAVDSEGTSVHQTGPKEWQAKIASGTLGGIPVVLA